MTRILLAVVLLFAGPVRMESEGSTYRLLSLIDKSNSRGPYFVNTNYLSSSHPAHWTPFTSFPRHREFTNNLQYKLQVTKPPKHSEILFQKQKIFPSQVKLNQNVERKQTDLHGLKLQKQQEPKHLGGRTGSFEDDSQSLLKTGLFGKLSRSRDLGTHFKYDLHPEEKLARTYFGEGQEEGQEGELDAMMGELTMDELKAAFRIFDDIGDGFISVERFRILKEIDEEFTDDEIDQVIAEVDIDKSTTIDFNEFVKIMTF